MVPAPITSLDRSQKVLLALGFIFLLTLGYRVLNPYRQPTVAQLTHSGKPAAAKNAPKAESARRTADPETAVVNLTVFLQPPESQAAVERDPFTPGIAPPMVATAPAPASPLAPEEGPEVRLRRDLERFQVFGYLEQGGDTSLFLQRGKQVLVVRKGDRLDGRYLIEDLTEDSLTVSAAGLPAPVEVFLENLRPLDAAEPGKGTERLRPQPADQPPLDLPPAEPEPEPEEALEETEDVQETEPEVTPEEAAGEAEGAEEAGAPPSEPDSEEESVPPPSETGGTPAPGSQEG
jgi:Tfp pilus assembly protein PilP